MAASIAEPLRRFAEEAPDREAYVFHDRHGKVSDRVSYRAFDERSDRLARALREQYRIERGDVVALAFGPGLDFIAAFFACARMGAIAVPVPSAARALAGDTDPRALGIIGDCGAAAILADDRRAAELRAGGMSEGAGARPQLIALSSMRLGERLHSPTPSDVLFLQYTSGSTSQPRGVVVSHANVLDNVAISRIAPRPTALTWLPHYHDMGLIGYQLFPLILGGTAHLFAPIDFVRRPALWLELMTSTRATSSSGPNFAFETCLREDRIPSAAVAGYDLSSMQVLMSGSEPVRSAAMECFYEKFAPAGLRREAMIAAYGLAEHTLAATSFGRRSIAVDRTELERHQRLRPTTSDQRPAMRLQSCGAPLDSVDLRIVDPVTRRELPPGALGEIWLDGPSRSCGYWRNPIRSRERFEGRLAGNPRRYLRTGDIGALHDGELYLHGRLSDMVIANGGNYFPEDVEHALHCALNVEVTDRLQVAAFAEPSPDGSESFVALIEAREKTSVPSLAQLHHMLRERTGAPVSVLAVAGHGAIARTTSGKVARFRIRAAWQCGAIQVLDRFDAPRLAGASCVGTLHELAVRLAAAAGDDPSIGELGLDSVEMVELSIALEQFWQSAGGGETLPDSLHDLSAIAGIRRSQIGGLVELFEAHGDLRGGVEELLARASNDARERDQAAMRADVRLADDVAFAGTAPERPLHLVTGATGFVGSYLLAALLRQTGDDLVALVRPSATAPARERLSDAVAATGIYRELPKAEVEKRIRVVEGDLRAPRLGLPDALWEELSLGLTDIFHCGAEVDYVRDYAALRAANVLGTAEIVRLAGAGARTALHHVSTTLVYGWRNILVAAEDDFNPDMAELDFGYCQTKWAAEQIVRYAQERGLAGRIYRPAFTTASRSGHYVRSDIVARTIGYLIRTGLTVTSRNQISLLPVDVVANNIVALARAGHSGQQPYNLTSAVKHTMAEITGVIAEQFGYSFRPMPFADFVEHANRNCEPTDDFFPLRAFTNLHVGKIDAMQDKLYRNRNYRRACALTPACQAEPPLGAIVAGIVAFLQAEGVVPAPPASETEAASTVTA